MHVGTLGVQDVPLKVEDFIQQDGTFYAGSIMSKITYYKTDMYESSLKQVQPLFQWVKHVWFAKFHQRTIIKG